MRYAPINSTKLVIAIVVASTCLVANASADIIAYEGSFGPQTFTLGTQVGGDLSSNSSTTLNWDADLNLNFVLPKFDPGLGDLTAIAIDFSGAVAGSADLLYANDKAPPLNQAGINVNMTTSVTFSDATNTVSTFDNVSFGDTVTATASPDPFNFVFGSGTVTGPVTLIPTSQHASYIGAGTVELPMNINFLAEATTSNGIFAATPFPTLAISSARIQYEYTAVPEPSFLLASGFCLVYCASRRRRTA